MFLAKNNGQIVLARDTEEQLLSDLGRLQTDEIVETDENYILHNGQYLTENQVLIELKAQKQQENTDKAKLAVENGHVVFKGAEFETNAQTVGDLTATMLLLQAQQSATSGDDENSSATPQNDLTYLWLSKDDQPISLSIEDFGTLGGLIAEYKNNIWQEKYLAYKSAIEQAETISAVENIVIDYNADVAGDEVENADI